MSRIDELQKQYRDNVAALEDLKKRRNEDGSFSADTREAIERNNADYEKIMADFKVEKDLEARTKEQVLTEFHGRETQTSTTDGDTRKKDYDTVFWRAMASSQRNAIDHLDEEEKRVMATRGRETRGTSTQITTTDSLGGYLVPTQFSGRLENMMKYYSVMSEYCTLWDDTAMGGGTLEWPTGDDTAETGNVNTAANQAAQRTVSDLAFGQVLFNDWLIDSNIIKISQSLLQDERVNLLQDVLAEDLSNRIGRKANSVWTNGTGTNQPYGLTVASTSSALTSASATALTAAELIRAQASIDYSYWNRPKTAWMMHQTVRAYLRTIDFSTATSHIFIPGNLATGEPETLLGWKININNDLAAVTAGTGLPVTATKHIYLGDFSKFIVRKIRNVGIERNDYLYWDSFAVGFMGWMRTDSNLINQKAIKSILQA